MLIGFLLLWFFFFVFVMQLGANAILAVSLAVCKAGAIVKKIPLYKVCVMKECATGIISS